MKPKGRGRQDDSYLFTSIGFVRVVKVQGNQHLLVRRIITRAFEVDLVPHLDFSHLAVRTIVTIEPQVTVLHKGHISEKAITVDNIIMTVPLPALHC